MSRVRKGLVALAASCVLAVLAPSVHVAAQASAGPSKEQLQLARSLYYDGLELIDKGDWTQAADRLQRVLAIRDSAVVSYHLANALHHLQRFVEARLLLQRVLNDATTSADIRTAAADLLPAIESQMGRLTLRLEGDLEAVTIYIDGRETPSVALDVPVPVDPHDLSVVAMRDGEEVATTTVAVGGDAGLQVEATLTIPERPAKPVNLAVVPERESRAEPLATKSDGPRDEDPSLFTRWWFWTAVGAVTAGILITSVALSAGGTEKASAAGLKGDFPPGVVEGTVR
jgi:Tetratricopeptide repeat